MSTSKCRDTIGGCSRVRRRILVGTLSTLLMLGGCTKVGPDFVKPDAPVADEWTEVGELQLNARDFIPDATKEVMAERTNWGDLLTPDEEQTALPPRTMPDDSYRWPDW